jgi:hypothetical protein
MLKLTSLNRLTQCLFNQVYYLCLFVFKPEYQTGKAPALQRYWVLRYNFLNLTHGVQTFMGEDHMSTEK